MTFSAKEIFYTLQSEGANARTSFSILPFRRLQLWSECEEVRSSAICQFCDRDLVGPNGEADGKYASAEALPVAIEDQWTTTNPYRWFVVLTGGRYILQVDEALATRPHGRDFSVAVETNDTVAVPAGIDWKFVNPKSGTKLVIRSGNELKLVFRQVGLGPTQVARLEFNH